MRERFDAGTGLVALGALLLLVSLFVDWFDPGGDAWAVFELADIVLAGCAIVGVVAIVPRYVGLGRAMPAIAFAALAVVAVQLIDPPPSARADRLEAGAWLALAATALMSFGAALSAARISITVDVRGRERRRRTAAIDAREAAAAAPAGSEANPAADSGRAAADSGRATADSGRASADSGRAAGDSGPATADSGRAARRAAAAAGGGPEPASMGKPRRRAGAGAVSAKARLDDDSRGTGQPADGPEPPTEPAAEPPADPDRTQALDPIDGPRDES